MNVIDDGIKAVLIAGDLFDVKTWLGITGDLGKIKGIIGRLLIRECLNMIHNV